MENQYSTEKDGERIDPKKIFETPSSVFSASETNNQKTDENESEDNLNLNNRKKGEEDQIKEKNQITGNQSNNTNTRTESKNVPDKKNIPGNKSFSPKNISQEKNEKKINKVDFIEYFLWISILLVIDIISFVIDFFDAGTIFGPFIQNITMTIVSGWFYLFKGTSESVKLERMIIKFLVNYIPWIPTLVFIFIIEAYLHNHPKIKSKIELTTEKKSIPTKAV